MTVSKDYVGLGIEVEENGTARTFGIHHWDKTDPKATLYPKNGPGFLPLPGSAVLQYRSEYLSTYGKEPDPASPTFHKFVSDKVAQANVPTPPVQVQAQPAAPQKSQAKPQAPTATPLSPKQKRAPAVAGTISLLMHFQSKKKTT